jgi:hypothetical protein
MMALDGWVRYVFISDKERSAAQRYESRAVTGAEAASGAGEVMRFPGLCRLTSSNSSRTRPNATTSPSSPSKTCSCPYSTPNSATASATTQRTTSRSTM